MPSEIKATIYKFQLDHALEIPEAATFLAAQMTPEGPCIWFLVNPNATPETRRFAVVKTGEPLPEQIADCPFLATFTWMTQTGNPTAPFKQQVSHLFEIPAHVKLPPPPKAGKKTDKADWWKDK